MDLASGEFAAIHAGDPHGLPRLSPDGSRLAFVARLAAGATPERLVARPDGGQARTVGGVPRAGVIEQVEWSPDGRRSCCWSPDFGADLAGYQGGYATSVALEGPDWLPEVKTDREENLWRRLWLLDAASLSPKAAFGPGDQCLGGFLVPRRSHHRHARRPSRRGLLVRLDLGADLGGDGRRPGFYRPADQIGLPVGSPDGRQVAFVEAVCSDRGIVCGTAKLAGVGGGVTALDTDGVEVTSLAWRDARTVHFAGQRAFETVVGDFDVETRRTTSLWASEAMTCGEWYPAARPLGDRNSLIIAEAYDVAPHVAIVEAGELRSVRSFAGPRAQDVMAGRGSMVPARWRAPDGLEIHGWLAKPEHTDGATPLVLDIHGGPVWANRNRWMGRGRATPLLVERGCAVLYPNPRGSSTRGQDFARLVKGDMGRADTGDFLAAIDHFVAEGLAARGQIACTGTSYGGFMSAWLVTQDPRFAAAAPISPVADWYSQHRTSQIPFFDEMFLADSAARAGGKFFERSPAMFAAMSRRPAWSWPALRTRTLRPARRSSSTNRCLSTASKACW